MEDTGGSCSSSSNLSFVKPVMVRVKRKSSQSPVEAFCKPQKRAMLDFEKLFISDSHEKVSEVVQNKNVFVQHVETVRNSDATIDILQSFVSNSIESSGFKTKSEERKRFFKDVDKHGQLISRSKQSHEFLAKNARFEQIWRSRKGKKETKDGDLHQIYNIYDFVRVDSEEKSSKKKENPRDTSMEDDSNLRDYLPLLRECLLSAAKEIESDMLSYFSNQGSADDYVYDLYTVQDEPRADLEVFRCISTVRISFFLGFIFFQKLDEEDDFYDAPTQSEFESDDSNAEDNPLNDYLDEEETSEDEDSSDEDKDVDEDEDEDEDESGSSDKESVVVEDYKHYDVDDEDFFYEEDGSDDEEYEWTKNA
ncbi:hypothetical protein ACHQM5_004993 [Ranunculus cassubicifolius]